MSVRGLAGAASRLAVSATFNGTTQSLPPVRGVYQGNSDCPLTSRLETAAAFFSAIVDSGREFS